MRLFDGLALYLLILLINKITLCKYFIQDVYTHLLNNRELLNLFSKFILYYMLSLI
jgi:hypothetical protein